jgi:hypothetical protein
MYIECKITEDCCCSISTAMDARLEYGVEWNSEVILRRMSAQGAYNLSISIASALQVTYY